MALVEASAQMREPGLPSFISESRTTPGRS
jgi:hypothetical protein